MITCPTKDKVKGTKGNNEKELKEYLLKLMLMVLYSLKLC